MKWIDEDTGKVEYSGKEISKVYIVSDSDEDDSKTFTLSPIEGHTGWETDSGYDGYGLPKELAEIYAKAINEYIEKHGAIKIK